MESGGSSPIGVSGSASGAIGIIGAEVGFGGGGVPPACTTTGAGGGGSGARIHTHGAGVAAATLHGEHSQLHSAGGGGNCCNKAIQCRVRKLGDATPCATRAARRTTVETLILSSVMFVAFVPLVLFIGGGGGGVGLQRHGSGGPTGTGASVGK